jgi:hypothetical protein
LHQEGKEAFDNLHQIRQKELEKGVIVLKYNPQTRIDRFRVRKLATIGKAPIESRK